jgi:hypothetical protein
MKKVIIVMLLIVVVPIYVWDAYQLVSAWKGHPNRPARTGQSLPQAAANAFIPAVEVRFIEQGKSPFVAYAEQEKPRIVVDKKVSVQTLPAVKAAAVAPKIVITGIMWNPQTPLAMLTLPDGSSTVAKAGQTLAGGIMIKTIEKNRIQVVYEKASFWIAQ